jgi:hypothetical protein
MPTCVTCTRHYFLSSYNQTKQCDSCLDVLPVDYAEYVDDLDEVEIDCLVNGQARKTKASIFDDNDVESFSS